MIYGDAARVQLSQGYEAIIDASDVELVSRYRWHTLIHRRRDGSIRAIYATSDIRQADGAKATIRLHRLIASAPADLQVDHINGSGLDNRRINLRVCSNAENSYNQHTSYSSTSGYKGVSLYKRNGRWQARIGLNGKRRSLGFFDSALDAALAYDRAATEQFGAFARLNFTQLLTRSEAA